MSKKKTTGKVETLLSKGVKQENGLTVFPLEIIKDFDTTLKMSWYENSDNPHSVADLLSNPEKYKPFYTGGEKEWNNFLYFALCLKNVRGGLTKEEVRKIKQLEKKLSKTVIERLHKQPRNLLKSIAKNIGNTTESPSLYSLPMPTETDQGGALDTLKSEISKTAAALSLYLIQLYQENDNKPLEISNLAPLCEQFNCNNYRLKIYLLFLGGYTYPIIDRDETTKELIITSEQMFKIEFRYSKEAADKYKEGGDTPERYGTQLVNFIKDEPLKKVVIQPNERFIRGIEGRGLGNILTVSDKLIGLIQELTDIATKLLSYSSSNKPSHKIGEDNLIDHLGLKKQLKAQGRPRVRATILKGLQELKDKGHIKNYNFEEDRGLFSWSYTDKYVRFKEGKKGKTPPAKEGGEGVR
jgi:hypothetical protein